jgi:hypothetical protein
MPYNDDMQASARHTVSFCASLVALGAALGLLFFGLMALIAYHHARYDFVAIGLLGVGTIVAGLVCLLRPTPTPEPQNTEEVMYNQGRTVSPASRASQRQTCGTTQGTGAGQGRAERGGTERRGAAPLPRRHHCRIL